MMMKALQNL